MSEIDLDMAVVEEAMASLRQTNELEDQWYFVKDDSISVDEVSDAGQAFIDALQTTQRKLTDALVLVTKRGLAAELEASDE
ncbi:MAG: hypothetical protein HOG18_06170 [Proteobacteria bacterium]|jgi:hypothetical protein|nr:hypothetical protein [Pseudomonadota bacterium]MDB4826102.1 hypothetical protein [Gammaproteobacteria bacterium]MBT4106334.1 hypothetical protein [Pseudomonadota bacterium]MBT4356638.1 hypothetical protein [Pseudomonadota bacterium]MBT4986464.1 hypothetical protein [Pseudomonadota bacterium]